MQDTELPEKIEPTSLNFQTELASQLAELVPEAMSDGKLDVTKLREMINGDAENSPEKFGLFWPGKRAAQALAQIPTTATLIPAPEESVDWENTKNIFIEGDNLEVLKALQNSYRRKVKMIYIDPPYNTGKEFIYPDKFSEGLQGYLEYTGQKNEAGENTESKPETGGRRHSNWLSMMYPRLQLGKSLLTDDGVIFISIDDNEQSNLKELCDEVLGAENFIAQIIRNTNSSKNQSLFVSVSHEYCLVYARNIETLNKKHAESKWSVEKNNVKEYQRRVQTLVKEGLSSDEITSEL
jgi:adenine-specific DNA-methyltransferase